jgi:radical SAM/Cys-rich protein
MTNPAGAFLAPRQSAVEAEWKESLRRHEGVTFDRLLALHNMPIARFLEFLLASGNLEPYVRRLVAAFNPSAIPGLMCRNTLSIAWDGTLHDCDFNQMLDIGIEGSNGEAAHVRDFDYARLRSRRIRTARHCFGCTAGAGSSCGGATA